MSKFRANSFEKVRIRLRKPLASQYYFTGIRSKYRHSQGLAEGTEVFTLSKKLRIGK